MSHKHAAKNAARIRQNATGESYAEALAHVKAEGEQMTFGELVAELNERIKDMSPADRQKAVSEVLEVQNEAAWNEFGKALFEGGTGLEVRKDGLFTGTTKVVDEVWHSTSSEPLTAEQLKGFHSPARPLEVDGFGLEGMLPSHKIEDLGDDPFEGSVFLGEVHFIRGVATDGAFSRASVDYEALHEGGRGLWVVEPEEPDFDDGSGMDVADDEYESDRRLDERHQAYIDGRPFDGR